MSTPLYIWLSTPEATFGELLHEAAAWDSAVPRKGETVNMGGKFYLVHFVEHTVSPGAMVPRSVNVVVTRQA